MNKIAEIVLRGIIYGITVALVSSITTYLILQYVKEQDKQKALPK